jgi:hypothetical protein
MLDWHQELLIRFGPGMLPGIKHETWSRLLNDNRIDTPYQFRRMLVSAASILNSGVSWLEDQWVRSTLAGVQIREPIFVIGHWRSGTTYLHEILARDQQFAFPNLYQVFFPHTFLHTEWIASWFLSPLYNGKRISDNLVRNLQSPGEDEMAACVSSARSPFMGYVFPRNRAQYDKYLTFRSASQEELGQWQTALLMFLKKITWKYRKPLILKSPTHTCRIRILLEMFPDARFIHIHRNPYEVFRSTLHLDRVSLRASELQDVRHDLVQWTLQRYTEMYDVFLDEKHLIPPHHFFEIAYDDLIRDTVGTVETLYNHLGLSGFRNFIPVLNQYIGSLSNYKKNEYHELPTHLRQEVGRSWRRFFDMWKYPI